ncbi:MAG: reverse transcriptase family protein, partial [Bacteroidota bacterium]
MNINFAVLNTQGSLSKLDTLFAELRSEKEKKFKIDVCLLSEISHNQSDENFWEKCLKGKVFINGTEENLGRGTALVFMNSVEVRTEDVKRLYGGKILIWKGKLNSINTIIVNIHSPTDATQTRFFEVVYEEIKAAQEKNYYIWIGGDFNATLEAKDMLGGSRKMKTKPIERIKRLMSDFSVFDCHQSVKHPIFTWRAAHSNIARRLDYLMAPVACREGIKCAKIIGTTCSDHDIVFVRVESKSFVPRGKGLYKLNTTHLKDQNYERRIRNAINQQLVDSHQMEDKQLRWDLLKHCITTNSSDFSKIAARNRNQEEKSLKEELKIARDNFASKVDQESVDRLNAVEKQLETALKRKQEGSRVRSRCNWIANGEKNTKYFFGLEKARAVQKTITHLETDRGPVIDMESVQNEIRNHFQFLLSERQKVNLTDPKYDEFLRHPTQRQLSQQDIAMLREPISLIELEMALKSANNGRSPGIDGLPAECLLHFWDQLKTPFFDCIKESQEKGHMSISQRKAVVTLLPKPGKDLKNIANYRGISLLCSDYKVVSSALASRLKKVLPSLIAEEQTGFIKGRQIAESIQVVKDAREYLLKEDKPGYLLCVDLKQAFDSISFEFMDEAMKSYGFPPEFINWIRILRNNTEKCVMNNGYSTKYFKVGRGCAQGDPIAPYLYLLCHEKIAHSIKYDQAIKGIIPPWIHHTDQPINEEDERTEKQIKGIFYADDSSFILSDKQSIKRILDKFETFAECSGLQLSKTKTEVTGLGSNRFESSEYYGVKIEPHSFKLLGYHFSHDAQEEEKLNFWDKIPKMKATLSDWQGRGLTTKGKILIAKTLALSQITFPLITGTCNERFKKKVDELVRDFVWDKRTPKIRRQVLIQDYENGGLKYPCIYNFYTSLKCRQLHRLMVNKEKKWTAKFHFQAENDGGIQKILSSNYDVDRLNGNYD